ncbi:MAG TPA: endonuclease/exonuclease/phosphatase family protein [Thermoanaerobaculia bacterium]|nr:endonuclease/exonuclease/phosphatase family protein [Thermoanaerobaculia bacterium]
MRQSKWLRGVLAASCALPVAGTLLSLTRRPHWIFRMWDFPRVQLAALAAIGGLGLSIGGRRRDRPLVAAAGAVIAWQLSHIHTYTRFHRRTVKRVRKRDAEQCITVLMTNVRMENERHELVLETIAREDPDVVLAVEVDARWDEALTPLGQRYPYSVRHPRDNWYGMVLYSKLELIDPRIEFLVQDDIPSIQTRLRLRSGVELTLHGLHPRPPEPIRNQPSSPRDAELVIVGRAIGDDRHGPTIVAGDLNDVAWSPTSELFVRLSGLLDPRAGRGFYNTYNANNPLFRYPLDHVFHSNHFKLVRIERQPWVGSDHFPMLIELQYEPHAAEEQDESHEKPGDQHEAQARLEQEAHDAATGADRPRE